MRGSGGGEGEGGSSAEVPYREPEETSARSVNVSGIAQGGLRRPSPGHLQAIPEDSSAASPKSEAQSPLVSPRSDTKQSSRSGESRQQKAQRWSSHRSLSANSAYSTGSVLVDNNQQLEEGDEDEEDAKARMRKAFDSYVHGGEGTRDTMFGRLRATWRHAPLINRVYDDQGGALIFSPESKVFMVWEFILITALLWTLTIGPLELVLTKTPKHWTICDNIVTFVFFGDIAFNFVCAFENRGPNGITMVFDRHQIIRRYISGWFLIDVVCALPLDIPHTSLSRDTKKEMQMPMRIMRLMRLLRLVKLMRANLLSRIDITFCKLTIWKCVLASCLCAHWMACIWASLVYVQKGKSSWIHMLTATKGDFGKDEDLEDEPLVLYTWSFYYAISLITTVGFGDITPQTDIECVCSVAFIVLGSIVWAYILSSLLGLIAEMDPHKADFESTNDELNHMAEDYSLPASLRNDVRDYFFQCQEIWKTEHRKELIDRMSRSLKGRVTLALCCDWIERVKYFNQLFVLGIPGSLAFVVDVAHRLRPKLFSPGEELQMPVLYIVRKGLIVWGARLYSVGEACGEDFLLAKKNRLNYKPTALTMCGTLALAKGELLHALDKFPAQRKVVRGTLMWLAMRRGLARELRKAKQRTPEAARQAEEADDDSGQENGEEEVWMESDISTVVDLQNAVSGMQQELHRNQAEIKTLLGSAFGFTKNAGGLLPSDLQRRDSNAAFGMRRRTSLSSGPSGSMARLDEVE